MVSFCPSIWKMDSCTSGVCCLSIRCRFVPWTSYLPWRIFVLDVVTPVPGNIWTVVPPLNQKVPQGSKRHVPSTFRHWPTSGEGDRKEHTSEPSHIPLS